MSVFVTFEGGEGTGKSTQIKLLSKVLEEAQVPHILTREPGGTPQAEKIRPLLVQGEVGSWDGVSEYLLLSAGRRHHITSLIKPQLKLGKWVICDRYQDSSCAYQHYGHGIDLDFINHVYDEISGGLQPDVTFFIDLPPEAGLLRAKHRQGLEDRYESMDIKFHHKVYEGYKAIAKANPQRYITLDGSGAIEEIHHEILKYLKQRGALDDNA